MKVKKINKFKTQLPSKGAFLIDTDPDFPKLHTLCIASGKRGGGKSVAVANLVKKCKDKGYYDKIYLITPTYKSNKSIWDIADIEEEDVYEPTVSVLKTITENVEQEKRDWDDFLKKKQDYKKYNKEMQQKNINHIDPDELINYYEMGFMNGEKPEWKYKVERPPRLAVIIDDSLGTDLMAKRTAGLVNTCIKHRHLGDGLGISIFMLVQSYCAQGGINRAIRENCTHLMLFKINDQKQIDKVKEECDLPVTNEEFTEMCDYAHSIPYNFLFIDFAAKKPCQQFRSGFDNYLRPPSIEKLCDCNK
jgi:hypothetical protein